MAATEADPSLEQAILAFLRQQEENQLSSEEGQENPIVNGTSSMGLPEDIEPHLAAAKANMLKQGPALAAGGSEVVKNLTPFALQIGGSALAYNVGLGIFQLVGLGMRVSCNSSLWGPCLGCLGVGVASALAGHASRRVHKGLASGRPLANELLAVPPWQGWQMEQALMDALVGMSAFKVLGGQFRRIMPSDLRYPGAFAKGSMPTTRSAKDDSTAYLQHGPTRVHLEKMLIKDGCHSCGKRGGGLHADHMPPNKLYKEAKAQAERRASQPHRVYLNKAAGKLPKPLRDRARELMIGLFDSAPPGQHFYPHCTSCSNKQGQLLANGSRGPLVWHRLGVPPGSMPGILAGFRFFTNPPSPPPSSTGGKGGRRGKQAPPHKQQQQQQGQPWWPFSLLESSPVRLPYAAQASAAHPPTLLVGYDSEEDEDEEASGASGAALRAGSSPALVLSVAENGPQIGRAAVDLWTYAVRITPEDLAEEAAPYQGSIGSAAAMASSCSYSSAGSGSNCGKPFQGPIAGTVVLKSTTATAALGDLLSPTLCASPSPVEGHTPRVVPGDMQQQQQQQQQQQSQDQWNDVAWPDATTPRAPRHHLPMHTHDQQQHHKQEAEGVCLQGGVGESSVAASVCKPRHALSPGLQAVLAELLKSSTGADLAAAQQQQREVGQQRQLRWHEKLLQQQQQQQQGGQQQHEQGRTSVGVKRPRTLSNEFAAHSNTIPLHAQPQQQQQQQQQQQGRMAGSDDISPRSKPLHAHVQAHSQQLQQQWQHEQMLRHWRIHH